MNTFMAHQTAFWLQHNKRPFCADDMIDTGRNFIVLSLFVLAHRLCPSPLTGRTRIHVYREPAGIAWFPELQPHEVE